jgi:hypothetical protein
VRKETHIQFWWENLREKDQLEGTCLDRSNIKTILNEMGWEGMDWFYLAQGMEERRHI